MADRPAYLDPAQPLEAREQDLVKRMTLAEEASMRGNTTPGVPRPGVPKYDWGSEALRGVANAGTEPITALRRWDTAKHADGIPSGERVFRVGASSADIRQTAKVRLG